MQHTDDNFMPDLTYFEVTIRVTVNAFISKPICTFIIRKIMAHFSGKLPAQISSPSQLPSIMTRNKSTAPRVKEKQENKERRRVANRRSAQKSRFREMVVMEELQKRVDELSKQNEALRVENINFRREMAKLQGDPGIDTFRLDEISQHGRKRALKA